MTYKLQNRLIEVHIDHPLSNYQNSRFDWTGKITDVKYRGKPVTITELPDGANEHELGKGLYNEFSMDTALGFEEAELGGWFHKIGVGLLKKEGAEYHFHQPYQVKPAQFVVSKHDDRIVIECISDNVNGYAYHLRKEISLKEDQLVLSYSLKNTGDSSFETEEYAHNFLAFDQAELSPDYELETSFQISKELCESTCPEGLINFSPNSVHFLRATEKQFLIRRLNGDETVPAQWKLSHKTKNIGMSETASFQTSKMNMWGWKHVISPELFYKITLQPGETKQWSRSYHFFNIH